MSHLSHKVRRGGDGARRAFKLDVGHGAVGPEGSHVQPAARLALDGLDDLAAVADDVADHLQLKRGFDACERSIDKARVMLPIDRHDETGT